MSKKHILPETMPDYEAVQTYASNGHGLRLNVVVKISMENGVSMEKVIFRVLNSNDGTFKECGNFAEAVKFYNDVQ